MRLRTAASATLAAWIVATLFSLLTISARAADGDMKIEAQLIWATNDKEDPKQKSKPVAPEIREKLKDLPLRWSNYFEINKTAVEIPKGETKRVKMSEKCEVEIKNIGSTQIEVALIGKGDPVWKRVQSLPKDEILILGGNAPNSTAWLVALKRTK